MYKACVHRNHLKVATLGSSALVNRYWIPNNFNMSKPPGTSGEAQHSNPKLCWDIYYSRKSAYEEVANQALNKFRTSWVRIPTMSDVIKTSSFDWTQSITSDFVRSRGKPTEKAFTKIGLVIDKNVAKAEVGPEEAEASVAGKIGEAMFHNNPDEKKADSKACNFIDEEISLEDKRIEGVFTKHLGRTAILKKMSDFDFLDAEAQADNRFYDYIDNLNSSNAMEVYELPKKETQTESHEKSDGTDKPVEKLAAEPDRPDDNPDSPDKIAAIEEIESTEVLGHLIDVKDINQLNIQNYQDGVASIDDVSEMAKVEQPLKSDVKKSKNAAAAAVHEPAVPARLPTPGEIVEAALKANIPEGGICLTEANEPVDFREMFVFEIRNDSIEPIDRTVVIDNKQPF